MALETPTPSVEELRARFETAYFERFKVELPEIRARVVNANTSVIGHRHPIDLSVLIDGSQRSAATAPEETREVRFDGKATRTPVYVRDRLPEDVDLAGPALITQSDTTILVPPGDARSLADAIRLVLTDTARREQLIESGLKRAEEFSMARLAEVYLARYERLIAHAAV